MGGCLRREETDGVLAPHTLEDCVWRMEQCRLEIEKLASSVALAEYEQEAGPARLAKLARSVQ